MRKQSRLFLLVCIALSCVVASCAGNDTPAASQDNSAALPQSETALEISRKLPQAQAVPKVPAELENTAHKHASDFSLQDLQQQTYRLSDYRDKKPVTLFFWTTSCPYCRDALRMLNDFYPTLIREGWEVLTVNIGEPSYRVENFAARQKFTFTILLDKNMDAAYALNVLGVPTFMLIDKKGNIVFEGQYFPKEYKELIAE